MTQNQYYRFLGILTDSGVCTDNDPEKVELFAKIRRLAIKHNRLAEYSCNGEGTVNGRFWRLDNPKAYSKDKDGNEVDVFDIESVKIEAKITALAVKLGVIADFQGDPRGYTVKLTKDTRTLDLAS